MELLSLQGLSKFYTTAQSVVVGLNNINLSFQAGEFVAITGESGSGKSTMAHVLGGILPYEGGELLYKGKPTSHYDAADWERYRRDNISFISQSYGILPGCTVLSNVVSALRLSGFSGKIARKRAAEILKQVELWKLRRRRAARLSSGQKQRLSIARALAKPAPILIADEPTGNLDRENSLKVISLLKEASKERLVILITHDFEEAESSVTRRIHLQDGAVSMDIPLQAAEAPCETEVPVKRSYRGLSLHISRLQLRARPIWSFLMLLLFTLSAFAVFAFLGTFLSALDDTDTRIYDQSAFRNGNKERIVVVRSDTAPMEERDFEALLGVEYVESLQPYGYAQDLDYSYREDIDYRSHFESEANGGGLRDDNMTFNKQLTFYESHCYVQTEPMFADGREFLTAGRRPECLYEVVAVGGEELLGQTFPVYIQDRQNWSVSVYLCLEVEVVGVTNYGSGLYFHDDMGAIAASNAYTPSIYLPAADDLPQGSFRSTFQQSGGLVEDWEYYFAKLPAWLERKGNEQVDALWLTFAGIHASNRNDIFEVNDADFRELSIFGYPNQLSLYMEDYAYTDRVLEDIHALGYAAISPFREGSVEKDPELAKERMQTLLISILALIAVFLLQIFALRAMYSAQTENFRLLSNLGLRCRTAKLSVLWQFLFFLIPAEGIAWFGIELCGQYRIEPILKLLRHITIPKLLLLFGVHLLASFFAALWILRALKKQVYPFTVLTPDLNMEDEP